MVSGTEVYKDNAAFSTSEQVFWLLVWFVNNIAVTLVNKAAFSSMDFHYPATLSAVHMAVNTVGANLYMYARGMERREVDGKGQRVLLYFSFVFALNIVVGNISLRFVSVNFNQVMRSLVPAVVMLGDYLMRQRVFTEEKVQSVVPIVLGVAMATFGEMRFSGIGFVMTSLCVLFAALKAMLSGSMLTGSYKLAPLDLLSRMAPLSLCWMSIAAVALGEVGEIQERWDELTAAGVWPVVLFSSAVSFTLNITSFMANKATSPLTLTIASNVKQVTLIAVATVVFSTPVSFVNGVGIVIVILGSAKYSHVTFLEKMDTKDVAEDAKQPSGTGSDEAAAQRA